MQRAVTGQLDAVVAALERACSSAVAGHVAKVGYDFAASFEYGLDLILDALEKRRDAT